ncbi:glycosyltransferase family 2 protein [Acidithiobacillus thiooxidans]|uniref:glycosyltransferase family 2 protein n=1 Tax=Acidithiobacillus thiooxidans TaxID=930 RepID=UPI001C07369B|nr:glycosyltransferase family A protein [Acidithiobacillus thiooxidans]MBU2843996.1 glycosyltransferase family 2 protein [Acidithiobacillus thiooxidans]
MNENNCTITSMEVLATIIIPAFRRTRYVGDAIRSALAQTLQNIEIIVVDDSDSEDIKNICYSFEDARLTYRSNKIRLGVLVSCNNAVSESNGQYITVLNDDDLIAPEFLERSVNIMENNPHLALIFCDHWIIDEYGIIQNELSDSNTTYWHRDYLAEGGLKNPVEALFNGSISVGSTSVFRKSLINTSMAYKDVGVCADLWMACVYVHSQLPIYYIPDRLASYRVHGDSETNGGTPRLPDSERFIYNFLIQEQWFPDKNALINKRIVDAIFRGAKARLISGNRKEASGLFVLCAKKYRSIRCIIGFVLCKFPHSFVMRFFSWKRKDFYSTLRSRNPNRSPRS